MKGVAPRRYRGRHSKGEPRITQQPPGAFVAPSSQIQICAENNQVIRERCKEMASLGLSTGRSQPLVAGRSSRVEMCTDQAYPARADDD